MQAIGLAPALIGMFAKSFDGDDVMSLSLCGEQRTRVDWFAIEQHRVRAGESLLIAEFDAEESKSAHGNNKVSEGAQSSSCLVPLMLRLSFMFAPNLLSP